ncbi:MAG TPA: hypothetical protein VI854_02965 [Acidimicrobiia bacterium]|nr:hypothetical protein [Acidimicrobiia bacterium]
MARRGKRKGVLDWWQTVIDETKDFVDDSIDRLRDDDDDDDDELEDEIRELKRAVADLNAKLDRLVTTQLGASGSSPIITP